MAGAEWKSHLGGGSNYLCLPLTPEFLQYQPRATGKRGYVYSAEYETGDFPPLDNKFNHDVPCAVCRANNRGSLLTIPAMITCPFGWTQEYYGYLMTAYYRDATRDYTCVDRSPESILGGDSDENGGAFYPVEGRCSETGGNLPCSLYPEGRELACVVCTK